MAAIARDVFFFWRRIGLRIFSTLKDDSIATDSGRTKKDRTYRAGKTTVTKISTFRQS